MTNVEVLDFVRDRITASEKSDEKLKLSKICEEVIVILHFAYFLVHSFWCISFLMVIGPPNPTTALRNQNIFIVASIIVGKTLQTLT